MKQSHCIIYRTVKRTIWASLSVFLMTFQSLASSSCPKYITDGLCSNPNSSGRTVDTSGVISKVTKAGVQSIGDEIFKNEMREFLLEAYVSNYIDTATRYKGSVTEAKKALTGLKHKILKSCSSTQDGDSKFAPDTKFVYDLAASIDGKMNKIELPKDDEEVARSAGCLSSIDRRIAELGKYLGPQQIGQLADHPSWATELVLTFLPPAKLLPYYLTDFKSEEIGAARCSFIKTQDNFCLNVRREIELLLEEKQKILASHFYLQDQDEVTGRKFYEEINLAALGADGVISPYGRMNFDAQKNENLDEYKKLVPAEREIIKRGGGCMDLKRDPGAKRIEKVASGTSAILAAKLWSMNEAIDEICDREKSKKHVLGAVQSPVMMAAFGQCLGMAKTREGCGVRKDMISAACNAYDDAKSEKYWDNIKSNTLQSIMGGFEIVMYPEVALGLKAAYSAVKVGTKTAGVRGGAEALGKVGIGMAKGGLAPASIGFVGATTGVGAYELSKQKDNAQVTKLQYDLGFASAEERAQAIEVLKTAYFSPGEFAKSIAIGALFSVGHGLKGNTYHLKADGNALLTAIRDVDTKIAEIESKKLAKHEQLKGSDGLGKADRSDLAAYKKLKDRLLKTTEILSADAKPKTPPKIDTDHWDTPQEIEAAVTAAYGLEDFAKLKVKEVKKRSEIRKILKDVGLGHSRKELQETFAPKLDRFGIEKKLLDAYDRLEDAGHFKTTEGSEVKKQLDIFFEKALNSRRENLRNIVTEFFPMEVKEAIILEDYYTRQGKTPREIDEELKEIWKKCNKQPG